jgi:hypothetical protein
LTDLLLTHAWLVHVALNEYPTAAEQVRRAVQRTLAGQRPDGSWPYGEAENLSWVDSFHTGYVLACLERLRAVDPAVDTAVARGAAYYATFFARDGRASLWPDRAYPEDAHSAVTGMSTLALLVGRGLAARAALEAVAGRVLTHGLRDGRAICRHYRLGATRVHYLRWCDAHIALGLVDAAAALQGIEDLAPGRAAGVAPRRRGTASTRTYVRGLPNQRAPTSA